MSKNGDKKEEPLAKQLGLFISEPGLNEQEQHIDEQEQFDDSPLKSGVVIPLELDRDKVVQKEIIEPPELPARWEDAREAAERKNVFQLLLQQMKPVSSALEYLEHLVNVTRDEGCAWVVYGEPGSGKSSFFHTLEYRTSNQVRTHVIVGSTDVELSDQLALSKYLKEIILNHKKKNGETHPLVIILEQRETTMSTEERIAIAQALRNVLRAPGPGKNVIFVLPVNLPHQGSLFLEQANGSGVFVPGGNNSIFAFQGPSYDEYVDILCSLFIALNDRDISEYGLQRSDLQDLVTSQRTIGQYIRVVREDLGRRNAKYKQIIKDNSYRPFTVITCFVNPLPAYRTEPTVKGMTLNAFGKIRTGELLRVTQGNLALAWREKRQALQNIVEALDLRIVEIPPEIIAKLLYAYGMERSLSSESNEDTAALIGRTLAKEGIEYNAPKSVRQNLRQQLAATNLFRIIAGSETKSHQTPKFSTKPDELSARETTKRNNKQAEIEITKLACESSHNHQHTLHRMFARALKDLLENSTTISTVADFKAIYPEACLTLADSKGARRDVVHPDIVIEMQDKLFLLEFCWRSSEQFTYADIASYVSHKINDSYMNLPLASALASESIN